MLRLSEKLSQRIEQVTAWCWVWREEEQEDKKTRRSWADDGKATIELLTHVPLGPVFSDMALRGGCFLLGRTGRPVSFGYRLQGNDER